MMALPTPAVAAIQIAQARGLVPSVVMVTFVQSLRLAMTASPMPVVRVTWIVLGQGPVQRAVTQVCPELEECDDGFTDACGTCNADCTGAGSGRDLR